MLLRSLVVLLVFASLTTSASAGIIFQDNFDADTIGIPQGSLINWTIDAGTVDVVGASTFGYLCNNGTAGYCLDLDGTPGNATITTKTGLSLLAGDYEFSFDYGNNFGTDNKLEWDIGVGALVSGLINIASPTHSGDVTSDFVPNDIYWNSTTSFSLGADLSNVYIQFTQLGPQDNGGTVLDNVVLTYLGSSSVPEPGSLVLLGLGLLGLTRQRRAFR